jgi:hypothetical protein
MEDFLIEIMFLILIEEASINFIIYPLWGKAKILLVIWVALPRWR